MSDILLAPILSLYSPAFYRRMIHSTLGRGLLYLLYLAVVTAVILTLAFHIFLVPRANDFVEWLRKELPEIKLTAEGAQAGVPQPFHLIHPQLGKILTLDTNKDVPSEEEMRETPIFVTKTKAYIKQQSRQEVRVYNLVPPPERQKDWQVFTLTGDFLKSMYQKAFPYLYLFVFVFSFFIYFLWKFLASLFYSLIALVLNFFRKPKLKYENLLNCSIFALTPVSWIQGFQLIFSNRLPVPFWLTILITSIYLGIGILATQDPSEGAETHL